MSAWEDQISLNSFKDFNPEPLLRPSTYKDQQTLIKPESVVTSDRLTTCLDLDTAPLPDTKDREGYCGPRHFEYWLLGLRDYAILTDIMRELDVNPRSMLDMGCATGRVIRHFAAYNPEMEVLGCDINALHVSWCLKYLQGPKVFQSTSVPYFPLPDSSVGMLTAFSVFSHIEAFETAWLMEIARVLEPDGFAYLTVHTERTWRDMKPGWPIRKALERHPDFTGNDGEMNRDRLIFRWSEGRSYSSNVFLHTDYIRSVWGRFFEIIDIRERPQGFQDAVILKKRAAA